MATVRFETGPGEQMQIDFGQKLVQLGGQPSKTRIFFFVAVLGYSRRIFVRLSLNERLEEWQSGLAGAFHHFGGVPREVLIDNPKAMVLQHDVVTRKVTLSPAFAAFVKDWGVDIRACAPYRARTKGKTESGVKYFKNNALAGLSFTSYAALETHTMAWMQQADMRLHGTTHERPADRFEAAESVALRPLPARPLPARLRRVQRRVANDCLVNIDTIRYSVPHKYVRETVEVFVGEEEVCVYLADKQIAKHKRSFEPHDTVKDSHHYDGLLRQSTANRSVDDHSIGVQRSLSLYDEIVRAGGAQ